MLLQSESRCMPSPRFDFLKRRLVRCDEERSQQAQGRDQAAQETSPL